MPRANDRCRRCGGPILKNYGECSCLFCGAEYDDPAEESRKQKQAAGRKGAKVLIERHGIQHLGDIAKLGGQAKYLRYGREVMIEMGRVGGRLSVKESNQ